MIIQRFNLNLIPNQSPVIVHVNQYDTGTGRLIATLYEGNEPYSPSGTAVIQGTKPDGHGFQYTATLDGNVVTADLTEQMAPVAGDVRTQIVVTEPSGVTGTFAFIIRVQPSALPSDTEMSESDYQYIEEAIREAQEAVQTAQEATETAQEAVERAQEAISETQENAENSEAWAQGTRGGIPVEPTDPTYEHNAEYWAQYAERYAQGGLHYKASIPFVDIPTTGMREGDMYDITDDFTTDSRFTEGAGIKVKGGTNIAWNSDNKWDILALPYIPKTTFNGRSGSILPMAGDYDSKKILLSSILHIGGETQSNVQEALEALSDDGVKSFNGRSGSILPIAGDYDSEKILLASVLHIGGETQDNVQKALEALSDDGVKSFNGRSGSILPMAGDYSAEQVNYDSNQTVKQKIDALVTKEESDIAGQQSLLKDTVGWTGKNLLPYPYKDSAKTHNGVTYVYNSDNTITANGTATSTSWRTLTEDFSFLELGKKYRLSGCPTGGSSNSYLIQLTYNDGTEKYINDYGNGIEFTYTGDFIRLQVIVRENYTANNLVFKPMIRRADITDDTYEPYHESVETMYEEEIHGVNLLKNEAVSKTHQGITFTVNTDGSIVVNGTSTAVATNAIGKIKATGEPYILSGVKNGAVSTYGIQVKDLTTNVWTDMYCTDGDSIINPVYGHDYQFVIYVRENKTLSNITIRPMLRKADIEDSTYRPYNPQAIQNQLNAQGVLGAKNILPYPYADTTKTVAGTTYTDNGDGSVLVYSEGAHTSNSSFKLWQGTGAQFKKAFGNSMLILSGCPSGGAKIGDNAYSIILVESSWSGMYQYDIGDGLEFSPSILDDAKSYYIVISILASQSGINKTFYPMLRLASDPDDTYQPYAMTNRELTEKAFLIQPYVPSTGDLDNVKTTGIYGIFGAPTHSPESANYCTLLVNRVADNNILQVVFRRNTIYTRAYINGTWYNWFKCAGTELT